MPPFHPSSNDAEAQYLYTVRSPWQWVLTAISTDGMKEIEKSADLPSAKIIAQNGANGAQGDEGQPPSRSASVRRRQRQAKERRAGIPSTLRLEKLNGKTGAIEMAVHGTSAALDSLEDKDELVRAIQRCRCEHLNLSPPAVLISWDASKDEVKRVLGDSLPALPGHSGNYAVLKEPMGSRGEGVFFVKDAGEIHKIVTEHRQRAQKEPGFLDTLISAKGRIPSWVVQAEVTPCLLIKNKHKFHLRSYLLVVESRDHSVEVFVYNRHEVRMAAAPVVDDPANRDREGHITNGSNSETEKRELVRNVPELTNRGLQDKVETFLAATFGLHLLPDMHARVKYAASLEPHGGAHNIVRKFSVAAIDMMVCEDDRIYLLEVNVNPSCPPDSLVETEFKEHLTGFMQDMIDLIMERPYSNFILARDLLVRKGMLE